MNATEFKIYLKSNPTSKSKLNNKCTKLYNSLFTIIAKRKRERGREKKMNPTQLNQLHSIQTIKNTKS